ncbi:MAG: hypothetical protein BM556_03200 [Bacteriovorax sp. MedPE-SWde]|nr:MAG: hypothetical protein BM556_03200 [Bacteriovorax sp. MedPE-SWde]
MRPQKLTIQAFGPFAGSEEVDFKKLGSHPLFLINGQTGAGKSSILDAICFALYGQTTGKDRDATQMRCDHASPELLTEISLEFSLGDENYKVARAPTQFKPKARGEGTTKHQTEAKLWRLLDDGEELLVPKSASEATKIIEELTGLNVEQFRQVMVLPQGKFREFLMADSHQREDIFSKLFQTQIYKRMEFALKDQASGIKKAVTNLENQIKGILQGADLNTESEIDTELGKLKPKLELEVDKKTKAHEGLIKVEREIAAAQTISNLFDQLDKDKVQLFELDELIPTINNKKTMLETALKAKEISHIKNDLDKRLHSLEQQKINITSSECDLEEATVELVKIEKLQEEAKVESNKLDGLKEKTNELGKLLPLVDKLKKSQEEKSLLENKYNESLKSFLEAQESFKNTKTSIESSEIELENHRKNLILLPQKQSQLNDLTILGKQRKRIDDLEKEILSLNNEQSNLQASYEKSLKDSSNQEEKLKEFEYLWHSAQAAILAKELSKDEECPVCGSTQHPKPATLPAETKLVTKEDIESEKSVLNKIKSVENNLKLKLAELKSKLSGLEASLVDLQKELGEKSDISTDELRSLWGKLDLEIKDLLSQQKHEESSTNKLESLRQVLLSSEKSLEEKRSKEQKAKETFSLANQEEGAIRDNLPEQFRDTEVLNQEISKHTKEIQRISKLVEDSQHRYREVSQSVTEKSSRLEEMKKQLEKSNAEVTEVRKAWDKSLSEHSFRNEEEYLSSFIEDREVESLKAEIEAYKKNRSGLEATIKKLEDQVKDKSRPEMTLLNEKQNSEKEKVEEINSAWQELDNRSQQLNDVKSKLRKAHADNEELEKEYRVLGTLSEVANGQTGNKISLQRFVLSVLLDDVLVEASLRLQKMSKGRYNLLRKEDRAKGNKASGLELEVEDSYTGKTRSVATLSGGESFMSALSLALGLSDVVQAYAGGIKLDTLFIDEGFGSLDQESLDLAVNTLIDLQSSGRVVGIISHVSELKERMTSRIDVKSSLNGSEITVVAN